MAISFPVNPTLNQTYVYNSRTWAWNGTNWNKITTVITTPMLADSSVTTAKIADLAVTPAKLSAAVVASISQGSTPKITTIVYPGNDLAADIAGSQTITLNGLNFVSGCTVFVGATQASVVTFISTTQVTFTSPAKTAASYTLYLINPDGGTATAVPGLSYSGTPAWSTASGSIDTQFETQSFSDTVGATGDGSITYSLLSGTLPTGSSLNTTTGIISGTSPAVANSTTYSFVIRATDAQLQDSDRSFSITINPDVVTWSSPTDSSTVVLAQTFASNTPLVATSAVGQSITYTANTLPIGLSIVGSAVTGTPTTLGTTSSTFTATAAVTGKFATRTFNWSVAVGADTYFNLTTLLIQADTGPTYISDASSNTFEITPVGSVKSDTSQPFQEGYYSGFFNGSGDGLTSTTSSAFAFGTNDFTYEGFYYSLDTGSSQRGMFDTRASQPSTAGILLREDSTGFLVYVNGGTLFTASGRVANTWQHIALVRQSGTIRLYVNGVQSNSAASSQNFTDTNCRISGFIDTQASPYGYFGYISNSRVVKGVAVYTAAFTPPTAPLATIQPSGINIAAITGTDTSLLTLQSNRFKDQTAANLAITIAGTPAIKTLQPFTTTGTTYGSGYFNGSTDYLTLPSNANLNFSGSCTIEFWVYSTSNSTSQMIWASTSDRTIQTTTGSIWIYWDGTANRTFGPIAVNTWTHIAVSRSGTTLKGYYNGIESFNITDSATLNFSNSNIGSRVSPANYLIGYLSNFRLVNGTAVYTTNFTPPTAPLTAIANTSLLTLQYNQGSNNSGFQDTSLNSSLVTKVGTPTQGTFTPFSQTGWSGLFNGSTDWINTTTNAAFTFGTAPFTIEAWVYMLASATVGQQTIFGNITTGSGDTQVVLGITTANTLQLQTWNTIIAVSSTTIPLYTWTHCVGQFDGTTYRVLINGISRGTGATIRTLNTDGPGYVGYSGAAGNNSFNGYLSNVRVVKGVAVYTTPFTPSTSPLTITQSAGTNISAITGTQTSLLTLQNNRFKDNSANAFTITPTGTPKVQVFSPFAPASLYSAATNGGAMYFNATTTDYLTVPANNFTTGGNWTVECWGYSTSAAVTEIILNGLASDRLYIEWVNGSLVVGDAIANTLSTGNVKPVNQWYHLAVVKSGTAYTAYINGISIATSTTALTAVTLTTWQVGARTAQSAYFTGHMSNLRIVNGVAVYTGAFTPPTLGFVKIDGPTSAASYPSTTNVNITFPASNTSLLINGTNGGIIDATSKNLITTVGDARISTAQKKYGTGSMYFDGTGDYLAIPSSPILDFANDFTVEAWVFIPTTSASARTIIHKADTNVGWALVLLAAGSVSIQCTSLEIISTTTLPLNQWNHVAVVRSGTGTNNIKFYLNGVLDGQNTNTTNTASAVTLGIGAVARSGAAGVNPLNGYIDDLRITKYARYTGNFTPPAVSFVAR